MKPRKCLWKTFLIKIRLCHLIFEFFVHFAKKECIRGYQALGQQKEQPFRTAPCMLLKHPQVVLTD